jgi:hypothetical protein
LPLSQKEFDGLITCDQSLEKAKENLQNYGYKIEQSTNNSFKSNLVLNKDLQKKRMFGSISSEVYDSYEVDTIAPNKIKFKIFQKIIRYPLPETEGGDIVPVTNTEYISANNSGQELLKKYSDKICSAKSYVELVKDVSSNEGVVSCVDGNAKSCFEQSLLEKDKKNFKRSESLHLLGCHLDPKNSNCKK